MTYGPVPAGDGRVESRNTKRIRWKCKVLLNWRIPFWPLWRKRIYEKTIFLLFTRKVQIIFSRVHFSSLPDVLSASVRQRRKCNERINLGRNRLILSRIFVPGEAREIFHYCTHRKIRSLDRLGRFEYTRRHASPFCERARILNVFETKNSVKKSKKNSVDAHRHLLVRLCLLEYIKYLNS